MAIKISEAEAEQQKILAMQKGLFDLGRAAQQNQEKINIDTHKIGSRFVSGPSIEMHSTFFPMNINRPTIIWCICKYR